MSKKKIAEKNMLYLLLKKHFLKELRNALKQFIIKTINNLCPYI
jgi:hypothetical protein